MKWWQDITKAEIEALNESQKDQLSQKLAWWKLRKQAAFWTELVQEFPNDPELFYRDCIERGAFIYEARARFEFHDGDSYFWPSVESGPFGEMAFSEAFGIASCHSFDMNTKVLSGQPQMQTKIVPVTHDGEVIAEEEIQEVVEEPGWTPMIQFNLEANNTVLKRAFDSFIAEQRRKKQVSKRPKALCWQGLEAFDWIQLHPEKVPSSTQKKERDRAKKQFSEMYKL